MEDPQRMDEMSEGTCLSVYVKLQMSNKLAEWILDRKIALKEAEPDSKFAKGTKELITNLEKSKRAIDDTATCEI